MNINLEWCCKKQIKPLYDDIEYKNYIEPIKRFSNENQNIFKNSIKNLKFISNKSDENNDMIIQYYIKSTIDNSIIVIFPSALKHNNLIEILIKKLEEKGDIHYIKDIEIDYYMAYNLIYQLYASEKRMKNNSSIIYKIQRLGFIDGLINNIKIIVYTLKDKTKSINGKSAEFKMELRDIFVQKDIKTTIYSEDDDRYPRGYDYLHVSDDNNQCYEYSGIFFNKNSLKFLKKQKSWRMLEMIKTQILMNKLKNFFYNYSQNELEKLLIFSSGVLYSYGIREANDLDCILMENNIINPLDIEKLNKKDLDISFKGTKDYNDLWENELNNKAQLLGAKNYQELIINPKYFYYFMGFKILRLKYDIILRFKRKRPAQFTDLLIIRQMFNLKYKIEIPNKTTVYNEKTKKDDETIINKSKYLETIKYYLEKRYFIYISLTQIENWINNNINITNDKNSNNIIINDKNSNNIKKISNINNEQIDTIYIKNFDIIEDDSDKKIIYPSQMKLLSLGYDPKVIIYNSNKPYLYPGEDFNKNAVTKYCIRTTRDIKPKKNFLRIATYNVHNFISRCNQGIAPIFGTVLNPFQKSREIYKFINFFKKIDADILCLQELVPIYKNKIDEDITDLEYIQNNFNFEYFNSLMKNIGYIYKVIAPTQQGHFYDLEKRDYYYLANGIYSKIPLQDPKIFQFKYINRNIITAKIKYNNKYIQIFNIHLEYYESNNQILKNIGINKNQVIQQFYDLKNLIEFYKLNNNNIIICGDLNLNILKKNISYKNWEEKTKYLNDNFISINNIILATNFLKNNQTDFIIYNKKSSLKVIHSFVDFTPLSDHFLLFGDFL